MNDKCNSEKNKMNFFFSKDKYKCTYAHSLVISVIAEQM